MYVRRVYSDQFIQEAVSLARRSRRNLAQVSRSLGIPTSTMRQWMGPPDKAEKQDTRKRGRPSNSDNLEKQVLRLKRELSDVTMERDILKKAVAIFSKPQE